MQFMDALDKLKSSEEFKEWHQNHSKSYLSYGFIMLSPEVKQEWQIGFYNPSKDTLTTFIIGEKILRNPDSEIFKNNSKVKMLNTRKINVTLDKALLTADKLQKTKYQNHMPTKRIVILQRLDLGQIWNITYITHSFKTLNIKVDAETGGIVKYNLIDLFKIEK